MLMTNGVFDMCVRKGLAIILLLAGVCVAPESVSAKAKEKEPKASELLKEANEMMSQAQTAYVDGESKKAIELYRKALAEIARIERENPKRVSSSEFAPIRFRKALCETEIDRVMLEEVNTTARTMAVTDTSVLEAKRAERKKKAETNNLPEVTVKLAVKPGPETPDGTVEAELETKGAVDKPGQPVNVKNELEWVKDMLSVDRFDDAEKALLKVLKQEPGNHDARFLMALARVKQEKHAEAAVVIDDLLADNAADEPVLLLAAGMFTAMGKYAKAMDVLDKAMKANPQRPDGYLNMAWLLLEMKTTDTKESELYYRQAVKLGGSRDRDIERRLGIRPE